MYSDNGSRCSHRLGFPIRTSPDHSLLATPRGLSQLTASFIAYLRQGIHTHALSSLTIKSILNTDVFYFCASAFTCSKCPSIFNCQRTVETRISDFRCWISVAPAATTEIRHLTSEISWWAWVESNYRPHPYQGCA